MIVAAPRIGSSLSEAKRWGSAGLGGRVSASSCDTAAAAALNYIYNSFIHSVVYTHSVVSTSTLTACSLTLARSHK